MIIGNLESLRQPDITVWTLWDAGTLAGCGALKELDPQHGEIKSMRTASSHRRKGVATQLLQHLLAEAKRRGYTRVSLETGSMEFFRSSRAQARTTVGREFPISALSMAERGPSPTIAHVSCALSKIPYGGFSPVRLQAEVSL